MAVGVRRRDVQPNASERAELVRRLKLMGYTGQALVAIMKAGRSRAEIADALIAVQRESKRA